MTMLPDFVVVGDYGEGFDFHALNHAFRLLMNGAALIALQKEPLLVFC